MATATVDRTEIVRLYASGASLKSICARVGIHKGNLYRSVLADVDRRQHRVTDVDQREIEINPDESVRSLASRLGISKSQVQRMKHRLASEPYRDKVQRLYAQGYTLREIARATKKNQAVLYTQVIRFLPERRYHAFTDEHRLEIDANPHEGTRSLAARLGISKSTVHRYRKQRAAIEDSHDDERIIVDFVPLKQSRMCPVHGPVKVWPCVACAARSGR